MHYSLINHLSEESALNIVDKSFLSWSHPFVHNAGKGFGGFSKVFVACHRTSEKLVVVKQTNVDVQNTRQLEELKVCIKDILFFNKKVILI